MKCKKCGRTLGRYASGDICRRCRRYGKRKSEPKVKAKCCVDCDAPLSPRARNSRCPKCSRRHTEIERRKTGPKCKHCGRPLSVKNRSGFCQSCFYSKSKTHAEQKDRLFQQVRYGLQTGDPPLTE
jgi:hypothetical protein